VAAEFPTFKSVRPPPRLPGESWIQHHRRNANRYSEASVIDGSPCERCSAKNAELWGTYERFTRQKARLETVEKMLKGLKQPLPEAEQVEPGWDARRAELIKELEAERGELLEDG
jgi:hypothetical protein